MCIRDRLNHSTPKEESTEKIAADNRGEIPAYNPRPIPPKEAWVIPPLINTCLLYTSRYGNKYQMDKAAAANSLFGGENQVDIACLLYTSNHFTSGPNGYSDRTNDEEMKKIFAGFQAQGVNEFVLDLRYNGCLLYTSKMDNSVVYAI